MTYTEADIAAHVPRPCPGCGNPVEQDWCDVSLPVPLGAGPGNYTGWEEPRQYVPGVQYCRNLDCPVDEVQAFEEGRGPLLEYRADTWLPHRSVTNQSVAAAFGARLVQAADGTWVTPDHLCPDLLRWENIGAADGWRGRVVRAFFWLLRAWPP